jgi:hypothetical protein
MESPKFFLAWSEKRSGQVADALSEALKSVFRGAIIPVKSRDFRAGSYWVSRLQKEMNEAVGAIIIITPENTMSPWLAFETGYFMIRSAPNDRSSFVCPYLFDFPIGGFSPPEGRLARGCKPPAFSRFLFQSAVKSAESF